MKMIKVLGMVIKNVIYDIRSVNTPCGQWITVTVRSFFGGTLLRMIYEVL